jgi:hypothetical protein
MPLTALGHPLHTRALRVRLTQRPDGRLDADAYVLDVRKRGFVPVGGDVQGPGIVHHMTLAGVVDPISRRLDSIVAAQPAVAFEAAAVTRGESCRDPIRRIQALAGAVLDRTFAKRLSTELGGPLGCSHLLTLAHLLGSTIAWALDRTPDGSMGATPARPSWRAGERVFCRDVVIDGHEPAAGRMQLAVQLTDFWCAPAPAVAPPMDRFASEGEVRVLATVEMQGITVTEIAATERRRGRADIEQAPWRPRGDAVHACIGLRLLRGAARELVRQFGGADDDRPLLDALLMLAPAFVQCAAGLSEPWAVAYLGSASVVAMGGFPDSCYMWRRGGALDERRQSEEPPPRLW